MNPGTGGGVVVVDERRRLIAPLELPAELALSIGVRLSIG
jgi:hypothetical protein